MSIAIPNILKLVKLAKLLTFTVMTQSNASAAGAAQVLSEDGNLNLEYDCSVPTKP